MPGKRRENKYHFAGWIFFVLCAFLFLFSAVRDGHGVLALASLVFLLGCVLFLVPLVIPHRKTVEAGEYENNDPPAEGS
jgi:hypothetical protein